MITVTKTCDACNADVTNKDQLWNVAIGIGCHPDQARIDSQPKHNAQWCRSCMEKRGLVPVPLHQRTVNYPIATIDELIRDIVREELPE